MVTEKTGQVRTVKNVFGRRLRPVVVILVEMDALSEVVLEVLLWGLSGHG